MKNYGAIDSGFSDLFLSAFLVGVSSSERRIPFSLFWSWNLDFIKQVVCHESSSRSISPGQIIPQRRWEHARVESANPPSYAWAYASWSLLSISHVASLHRSFPPLCSPLPDRLLFLLHKKHYVRLNPLSYSCPRRRRPVGKVWSHGDFSPKPSGEKSLTG